MALLMNVNSNIGINFKNAYIHIDEYTCNSEEIVTATINAYVSRDLMKNGATIIDGNNYIVNIKGDYTDNAVNIKKQIYTYMKTLDKYKDSTDALE